MNIAPAIKATLDLLTLWDLTQLHATFEEQEISLRALMYLTEDEICQLIPKIGPRTIFRGLLKQWRDQQAKSQSAKYMAIENRTRKQSDCTHNQEANDSINHLDLSIVKTEPDIQLIETERAWTQTQTSSSCDEEIANAMAPIVMNTKQEDYNMLENEDGFNVTPTLQIQSVESEAAQDSISNYSYEGETFNVYKILSQTFEGRMALDYYRKYNCLDHKNRKLVIGVLVWIVVEKRVPKYTAAFANFTQQLIRIFPTENPDAYFVPHQSNAAARGALYYKYSNYTRKLRKEGLLDYKIISRKPRDSRD